MNIRMYELNYELKGNPWKCGILALSGEDAIKTLGKIVKKPLIRTISNESIIHDVSEEAFKIIANLKKSSTDTPQTIGEKHEKYLCPWCDKSYSDGKYLKIHLNKAHGIKEPK